MKLQDNEVLLSKAEIELAIKEYINARIPKALDISRTTIDFKFSYIAEPEDIFPCTRLKEADVSLSYKM